MPSKLRVDLYRGHSLTPQTMKKLRAVVTGVPRGGTRFLAGVLQLLSKGNHVGHESVFSCEAVRKPRKKNGSIIEVSGFAWPYLQGLTEAGIPVFHLMRDPVDTANSWMKFFPDAFPKVNRDWPRALCMVWNWHLVNEKHTSNVIRVEKPARGLIKLGKELGFKWAAEEVNSAVEKVDRGPSAACNLIPKSIVPPAVKNFAAKHGYEY